MKLQELFPLIQANPIFLGADLKCVQKHLTDASMETKDFSEGAVIYSSRDGQRNVGILLSGSAQVFTGIGSEPTLLNTVGASDMFGIANLYADDEPFPTTILAKTSCRVLFIDRRAFCDMIENEPVITKNFLILQSRKILYLNRKLMTFTAGSAERKVAVFLSEHTVDGVFVPNCSMSVLANMLGIGRASLYRALDRLIECGWIEKRGKSYLVLNQDALAELI